MKRRGSTTEPRGRSKRRRLDIDVSNTGDSSEVIPAKPTAVGAYIFAGGFTLGVRHHFDVMAHLEESMYGVRTSMRANPNIAVHVGEDTWPLDDYRGRTDFLYCNPPCAPFSQAGATMRGGNDAWKKDPRLRCWRNCFVAFEAIRPRVFAIESVVRAMTAARSFVDELAQTAAELGYCTTHVLVDAKNHNMAQKRKRYFFVAHDVELTFDAPPRTQLTVNDLLDGVDDPGYFPPWKDKTHEALMHHLVSDTSFRKLWETFYSLEGRGRNAQGGVSGRPRIFIHRVAGDGLIGTITGDYFVHPTLDRFMGIDELKVLNGFPLDYWLEGQPGGQFSLLSRGVCPPVAEWLARNVASSIAANVPASGGPTVVDYR